MLPIKRAVQTRIVTLSLIGIGLALTGCQGKPALKVSSEGIDVCRERQAEAAPETGREEIQRAYQTCLKTIDAELKAQAQQNQQLADRQSQSAQQQALDQQATFASASERYSHCQLVREQVIEAERMRIRTLGPVMVAERRYGAGSSEARDAQDNYRDALRRLEELIPEPMRAGKPLIPDAVEIYQRCDQAAFQG
jgi:hypothetical protein